MVKHAYHNPVLQPRVVARRAQGWELQFVSLGFVWEGDLLKFKSVENEVGRISWIFLFFTSIWHHASHTCPCLNADPVSLEKFIFLWPSEPSHNNNALQKMWVWLWRERCDILKIIPFCFCKNSLKVMSETLIKHSKQEMYGEFSFSSGLNPPVLSFLFPFSHLLSFLSHSSSHSIAIEIKLDRQSKPYFCHKRKLCLGKKKKKEVFLVVCGEDFQSPEPSQNTEWILWNPSSTPAAPRLFPQPLSRLPYLSWGCWDFRKEAGKNPSIYHTHSEPR